jgi:hypothetical protein
VSAADPQPRSRWWRRRERVESRSLSRETLPPVLAPPIAAAEAINARSALGLADVFACVKALCDAAVLCELRCWRDSEQGRIPLNGGRGPGLLRNPAPGVTQAGLVASVVQNMACFGEAFLGKGSRRGSGSCYRSLRWSLPSSASCRPERR